MKRKSTKKRIAIIGYGSQGRAIALNLVDSGYEITIGLPSNSRSRRKANRDGFKPVLTTSQAVRKNEIICMAFPDHLHQSVFNNDIADNLNDGATIMFFHGLSIHFGFVKPPPICDVILIAPHAPGIDVRRKYLEDRSLSAFYAVAQDFSGHARQTALKLARAIGFEKKRLLPTSFEHEALGDMFGEQAVLCGGLTALIKNGFEVLIEKGIPPENAYLEVAFQLDLIIGLIKKHGIEGMFERISVAARYGSLLAGPKIVDSSTKKRMESIFNEIKSGEFTRKLSSLSQSDLISLSKKLEKLTNPLLEKAIRKHTK